MNIKLSVRVTRKDREVISKTTGLSLGLMNDEFMADFFKTVVEKEISKRYEQAGEKRE